VLGLLVVAFVALISQLNRMLYGPPPDGVRVGESRRLGLVPLGLCLAALLMLGLTVPRPVQALLEGIAEITSR